MLNLIGYWATVTLIVYLCLLTLLPFLMYLGNCISTFVTRGSVKWDVIEDKVLRFLRIPLFMVDSCGYDVKRYSVSSGNWVAAGFVLFMLGVVELILLIDHDKHLDLIVATHTIASTLAPLVSILTVVLGGIVGLLLSLRWLHDVQVKLKKLMSKGTSDD